MLLSHHLQLFLHLFCYNNYSSLLFPIANRSETNNLSEDPKLMKNFRKIIMYILYIYIFWPKSEGGGGRGQCPMPHTGPSPKRVVSRMCFNNGELRPKSWKLSFKWLPTNFWAAILVMYRGISQNFIWLLWVVITLSVTWESTSPLMPSSDGHYFFALIHAKSKTRLSGGKPRNIVRKCLHGTEQLTELLYSFWLYKSCWTFKLSTACTTLNWL